MAYDHRELDLQARSTSASRSAPSRRAAGPRRRRGGRARSGSRATPFRLQTTLGRALFNEALPEDYPFVDYAVDKKQLSDIVNDLAERYPKVIVAATLDALKAAGFHWATRSGVTISIEDVVTPEAKKAILEGYEAQAEKVQSQYERGLITDDERRRSSSRSGPRRPTRSPTR